MNRPLSPATQARILALWADGKNTLEIMAELCLDHESIAYNVIARSGGDTEPHPRAPVVYKQCAEPSEIRRRQA